MTHISWKKNHRRAQQTGTRLRNPSDVITVNLYHKLLSGSYRKRSFFFHRKGRGGVSFSTQYLLHSSWLNTLGSDFLLPRTSCLILKETHGWDFIFLTFFENVSERFSPTSLKNKLPPEHRSALYHCYWVKYHSPDLQSCWEPAAITNQALEAGNSIHLPFQVFEERDVHQFAAPQPLP